MLARAGSAIALAPSSSTWVATLRAAVRPLLKDPGYAVIALQHDIDPPPGLIGRFLNVVREFCRTHFKAELGFAAADWAERAVLSAACRCVRIKARSVLMNRSSMGGTMRSTVTGLLLREPTASA
jgi:hypothetical protein